jgi:hypothetical protein
MIKFFRNIRKNLLSKGKTANYLKYAIGEIVLVMIGILLALQVNNWNEVRKDNIRKNLLLKSLKVEFSLNLNQLDSVLYFDNLVVKSTYRFLHLDENEWVANNTDSLRVLLQSTSWLWTFDAQNGALRSGISSGDIHLIKNDSLINLLFSWQDVVADAKENEDRSINLRLDSYEVLDRFIRSVDYRSVEHVKLGKSKFYSDYQALINDPLFEDYIQKRYSFTLDAVNELKLVKKQNIKILELIDQEINHNKE